MLRRGGDQLSIRKKHPKSYPQIGGAELVLDEGE